VRWGVFLIAALLFVALDISFMSVFAIGSITPQLTPILATFVALAAPRVTVMWACLLLGLLLDLCPPPIGEGLNAFQIAGPRALGYFFAANLLLPLRTMVFRRNPLTLAVLTVLFAVAASLVVVMIWTIRSSYPDAPVVFGGRTSLSELGRSALQALASGAAAIPVGWFLVRTVPIWGFQTHGQRLGKW